MVGGESCPLRSDDILDASHETGDEIQLALANNRLAGIEQCAFGFIQPKKDFAFYKDRRLRRINVLGRFFIASQDPAAKTNHPSLVIANGKHQPPPKTIVVISSLSFANDKPGLFHERQIVALALGP